MGRSARNGWGDLTTGTLICHFETRGEDERYLVIEIGDDGVALSLWNQRLVRRFASADPLSAFLLAPNLRMT